MGYKEKASEPSKEIEEQVEAVKEQAREVYREARPWLVQFARLGTAAKGVVYLALGIFIMRAVGGAGSPEVDQRTTFQAIDNQLFFGPLLLALIATGLAGYVLWMFTQAVVDPHGHGTNPRGLIRRGVYIISGLSYAGLVLLAVQILLGLNTGPEMDFQDITAALLGRSFGPWLVGLVGVGFLAYFIVLLYNAMAGKFQNELELYEMKEAEKKWTLHAGRIGLIGRGIMIVVVGLFLIHSAIRYNLEEAGGLGEVLRALARQPYGPWILAGIATGLVAFGIYTIILVRYGRFNV